MTTKKTKKTRGRTLTKGQELVLGASDGIQVPFRGTVTATSLALPVDMQLDEWSITIVKIAQLHDATNWHVGDAMNFGEGRYGEMYAQAASDTGIPEDRLMLLKHVSLRVDPLTRLKELSWSHHREVAKLKREEQEQWLREAVEKGWSVRELKEAMRKKGRRSPNEKEGDEEQEMCPCCGKEPATMKIGEKCLKKAIREEG